MSQGAIQADPQTPSHLHAASSPQCSKRTLIHSPLCSKCRRWSVNTRTLARPHPRHSSCLLWCLPGPFPRRFSRRFCSVFDSRRLTLRVEGCTTGRALTALLEKSPALKQSDLGVSMPADWNLGSLRACSAFASMAVRTWLAWACAQHCSAYQAAYRGT
jgi:hypothetical protein